MSLYGDIAVVPGEKPASSLSSSTAASLSSIRLLQDHLRLRNRDKKESPASARPSVTRRAPGTAAAAAGGAIHAGPGFIESVLLPSANLADRSTGSLLGGEWDISQEYDPFRPNDFEKIVRERREERQRKSEGITVTAKKRLVGPYTSDEEEDDSGAASPTRNPFATGPTKAGAAIAPPKELTTSSEPHSPPAAAVTSLIAGSAGVSTTAAKIMLKMGYKDGAGLGKEEQGIAKPLQVTKVGVREAKIIAGNDREQSDFVEPSMPPPPPPPLPPSSQSASTAGVTSPTSDANSSVITEMMKNPTRIVLLTNMVGPGEVDEDLEPETQEECGKYGEVVKCVIFEIPGPNVRPEDAVRIFVEFKRIESAIKAVVDLNGRFFGGRTVRASFFDVDRFRRFDLMDK